MRSYAYSRSPPASPTATTFGAQSYLDSSLCSARPPNCPYRRIFDATQKAHNIDLDRFDIDIPKTPGSSASSRATSYYGDRRSSGRRTRPTSFHQGDLALPDLGEVDLGDGKNSERPQRFKAVIQCKKKGSRNGNDNDGIGNQGAEGTKSNDS
ncbi:hypothetical protein FRB94_011828 [Tulasnella sp. JGI-2019a]|nr:hypothetical protein FRB93_002275 [Tulasnella sp. JGI-2019a]KAG9014650.1 hypothetical protein FRB94_011828 [Tulasnella sp. JGI-2019a]KAG9038985.1 hypothetical protein FRB95_013663 [Tulasnella sp. JGI-2019a]